MTVMGDFRMGDVQISSQKGASVGKLMSFCHLSFILFSFLFLNKARICLIAFSFFIPRP